MKKTVEMALDFMGTNFEAKQQRDNRNKAVQALFEEGFMLHTATSPRYLTAKMLYQVMWQLMAKTKLLDATIHVPGKDENYEKAITDAVSTVFKNGNLYRALRNKLGAFFKMYLFGDAFIQIGTTDNKRIPLQYRVVSNSNVYVDNYATEMRQSGTGQNVSEMAIVFKYPKEVAYAMYPELKRNKILGDIPRPASDVNLQLEQKYEQLEGEDDQVEVCHYYNIREKVYGAIAGNQTFLLREQKGSDYSWELNGDPYIPIIHLYAIPSAQGFFNYGVGDLLYDLALVDQRLINMGVHHGSENTDPYTLINLPKGTASEFFNKLAIADQQKNLGRRAFIPVEYDVNGAQSPVSAQPLMTQNAFNEFVALRDIISQQLRRAGINIDAIQGIDAANPTATQILQEEETSNAFIKQTMEYNASEVEFLFNATLDGMKTFVNKSNKTLVQSTTRVIFDGFDAQMKGLTLGMVADQLKTGDAFVKVNSRTGAIPSNIAQQAQIARGLSMAPPGSPAQTKLIQEGLALLDRDISIEELGGAPAQGQQQNEMGIVSETDKGSINPRIADKEFAL